MDTLQATAMSEGPPVQDVHLQEDPNGVASTDGVACALQVCRELVWLALCSMEGSQLPESSFVPSTSWLSVQLRKWRRSMIKDGVAPPL